MKHQLHIWKSFSCLSSFVGSVFFNFLLFFEMRFLFLKKSLWILLFYCMLNFCLKESSSSSFILLWSYLSYSILSLVMLTYYDDRWRDLLLSVFLEWGKRSLTAWTRNENATHTSFILLYLVCTTLKSKSIHMYVHLTKFLF